MFKRGEISAEQKLETIIGPSVKVEGEFESNGDVTIEGSLSGSIKTKGNLIIGKLSVIHANVEAQNAYISGRVKGNIYIKDKIALEKTSYIEGDIAASIVSIQEGAHFTGNCSMAKQEELIKTEETQTQEVKVAT